VRRGVGAMSETIHSTVTKCELWPLNEQKKITETVTFIVTDMKSSNLAISN
jgi:hypothetical protein